MSVYERTMNRRLALSIGSCIGALFLVTKGAEATSLEAHEPPISGEASTTLISQDVADQLMREYERVDGFADVVITSPTSVRVLLTDIDEREVVVEGVTVVYQRVRHSRADYDLVAERVLADNPDLQLASYDFERSVLVLETAHSETTLAQLDLAAMPTSMNVELLHSPPIELDAAQGGMLSVGSGCTTGFRMKRGDPPIWRLTSANHSVCGSQWTTVNGVPMTLQSGLCSIDNSFASGSSLSTVLDGMSFSGSQGDPPSGALVYKYGVITGWTFGYRGSPAMGSSTYCSIPVYLYSGGTFASSGGDSGGPYITMSGSAPSIAYTPRGTHRGHAGSTLYGVRMSSINATGWYVG